VKTPNKPPDGAAPPASPEPMPEGWRVDQGECYVWQPPRHLPVQDSPLWNSPEGTGVFLPLSTIIALLATQGLSICTEQPAAPEPSPEPMPYGQARTQPYPPSERAERTARALDELAQIGSDVAVLLHHVSKGSMLQLGPASGRLVWKNSTESGTHGVHTHEAHGTLAEVIAELADRVKGRT